MPEADPIAELQRELARRGCPPRLARRIMREAAEHFEDLLREAGAQGLSPAQARDYAAAQLGPPAKIAASHAAAGWNARRWGWWPLLGLIPLPLVFAMGCPYFTFVAALPAFEFARRSSRTAGLLLPACLAMMVTAFVVPTGLLNALAPWFTAGLVDAGERWRLSRLADDMKKSLPAAANP